MHVKQISIHGHSARGMCLWFSLKSETTIFFCVVGIKHFDHKSLRRLDLNEIRIYCIAFNKLHGCDESNLEFNTGQFTSCKIHTLEHEI